MSAAAVARVRTCLASRTTPRGCPIRVEGLTKLFGEVRAVDRLSFAAEPGDVTAFLGPNGAGKTTTLRMLLGLVEPLETRHDGLEEIFFSLTGAKELS